MAIAYQTRHLIEAELRKGRSCNELSREFGVARSTIQQWAKGADGYKTTPSVVPFYKQVKLLDEPVQPREPWWYRYGVQHDDGAKLILERLPDTILCFGDMQAPAHHPDTLTFLSAIIARYKPDAFVCMGDEADLTGFKKHFMTAESLGPAQELKEAISFMHELFKIVPEAICLTSNHVADRLAYAQGQGNIPNIMMRRWAEVIDAPKGWVWRDYVIWGRWLLEHGHKIAKGSRPNLLESAAKRFNRHLSIMRGHHHSELGEHIKPVWMPERWQARQAFTGCLMDYRKAGYTRDACMVGCVVLVKGVPHPLVMDVDESNRFTGRLIEG